MQIDGIRLNELTNGERCILQLIMRKLLCAVHETYIYESVTVEFECSGAVFKAKTKNIVSNGWKEIESLFRSYLCSNDTEDNISFDITEGQELTVSVSALQS